jgi:hypothetical protein
MRMIDVDTRRPSSDPSPWMPFESRRRARDKKREAVLRTALQSFLDPCNLSEKNRKIMRASNKERRPHLSQIHHRRHRRWQRSTIARTVSRRRFWVWDQAI